MLQNQSIILVVVSVLFTGAILSGCRSNNVIHNFNGLSVSMPSNWKVISKEYNEYNLVLRNGCSYLALSIVPKNLIFKNKNNPVTALNSDSSFPVSFNQGTPKWFVEEADSEEVLLKNTEYTSNNHRTIFSRQMLAADGQIIVIKQLFSFNKECVNTPFPSIEIAQNGREKWCENYRIGTATAELSSLMFQLLDANNEEDMLCIFSELVNLNTMNLAFNGNKERIARLKKNVSNDDSLTMGNQSVFTEEIDPLIRELIDVNK